MSEDSNDKNKQEQLNRIAEIAKRCFQKRTPEQLWRPLPPGEYITLPMSNGVSISYGNKVKFNKQHDEYFIKKDNRNAISMQEYLTFAQTGTPNTKEQRKDTENNIDSQIAFAKAFQSLACYDNPKPAEELLNTHLPTKPLNPRERH